MHTSGNQILWTELEMRKRLLDRKRGTQPGEQVSARKGRQYSSLTVCRWNPWAAVGPSKRMLKKKGGRDSECKEKLHGIQSSREWGKRVEIKGNAQLVLNLWTPFSSWTDNTVCSSRKFSNQLCICPGPCTQQVLGLRIVQK